MNLKELFEKIYNDEIKENDVIVQHTNYYKDKYDVYICNDGFDFWEYDANNLSLSFFTNDNDENYSRTFEIIKKEEFIKIIEEKERIEKINRLQEELKRLKCSGKD